MLLSVAEVVGLLVKADMLFSPQAYSILSYSMLFYSSAFLATMQRFIILNAPLSLLCAATRCCARPSHVTEPYHACARKYKMAESAELKVKRSLKSL